MNNINIIEIVVGILATYRLTSLLQREVGPFELFVKIRGLFGIVHDSLGFPHGYPDTVFGKLFECFWCLSVWVGFAVSVMVWLDWMWILLPLAFSGASILCVEAVEK